MPKIRTVLSGLLGATLATSGLALFGASATAAQPVGQGSRQLAAPQRSGGVATSRDGVYLVMLKDKPVITYTGGTAGLQATAVTAGEHLDRTDPHVRDYVAHLDQRRDQVLGRVHGAHVLRSYSYASAGFSARMSHAEAEKLSGSADVLFVAPDTELHGADYETPTFLGLTGPRGLWHQLGGPRDAGDGVIIGDIDSGITPENPAFAALPRSRTDRAIARRWHGGCVAGTTGPAVRCNNKLIGAKVFGPGSVDAVPGEYFGSPRDYDGHGSHTASTAGGDYGVPMTVDGHDFGKFSGMAPMARIAMYKALWHKADNTTSGDTSDIQKAIDEAVADGVDVINFSITGPTSAEDDPIGYAFYNAAKAGIFVATCASNEGPGASTVENNYPWVTTVAASTYDVAHHATLTLGNGASYTGIGLGDAVPSSPIVLASDAGLAGADPDKVRECFSKEWPPAGSAGYLDPAKVSGRIVVCDRGVNDRVDKSRAVKEAGGVGMVLVNPTPNTFNADLHYVPTVHLGPEDGAAVKAYVAGTAAPTAALAASREDRVEAPEVASFSSRGPALATGGDLVKPDIMAPGVDMLAAVAPVNHQGRQFDFESGTSMATPHIAGLGALLRQRHPNWSPMAIKSVLMTTAHQQDNDGKAITTDDGAQATPFDMGSGLAAPTTAASTDLVYDSHAADWDRFLCGQGTTPPGGSCGSSVDASDLNLPSIGIGDLAGSQVVTRTLTNLGRRPWNGRAVVDAPPGVSVVVAPSRIAIRPGHQQRFTVTLTRTSAPFGRFAFGSLTWRRQGGSQAVRSVIAVRPAAISAPAEVHAPNTDASAGIRVQAGYSGTLTTSVEGPTPALENSAQLSHATGGSFAVDSPSASDHTAKFTVNVPAGTTYARFATFAADLQPGTDVDLYVYRAGTNDLVAQSSQSGSNEWVWIDHPQSSSYDVYVDLFSGPDQVVRQPTWLLSSATGAATVTPSPATVKLGAPAELTASWSGLDPKQRYLARLTYSDGGQALDAATLLYLEK